jgi:hypothetical protein
MQTPKLSSTITGALAGGLFVGLATALVFALALGPASGFPFGIAEISMFFILGAVFGIIAGGVAGASEAGVPTQRLREPNTSSVATVRA